MSQTLHLSLHPATDSLEHKGYSKCSCSNGTQSSINGKPAKQKTETERTSASLFGISKVTSSRSHAVLQVAGIAGFGGSWFMVRLIVTKIL